MTRLADRDVVQAQSGAPTLLERLVRQDRTIASAGLIIVTLLCWLWIVPMARDMYGSMTGASAWMMRAAWDTRHLVLLWAMWMVMMAGMMLPSAAPILLLYGGLLRKRRNPWHSAARIYAMGAGYLLVWAVFSVGATALQRILSRLLLLTPMMETATPRAQGILLLIAGVYQLSPQKAACLHVCRTPVSFLTQHWREGVRGALSMGIAHGVYCLGCCWALMLLLFAGGVMNLLVIGALTILVLIEKLAPFGLRSSRVSGAAFIGLALWLLAG